MTATACHLPNKVIPILPDATTALSVLESAGYESWLVGGFVRNSLLGQATSDIDIATAAPWECARDLFNRQGLRVIETGAAHGTITVIIGSTLCEITSFRIDGPSRDHRHPCSITPTTSITEDLARRDFTINALAYHPQRGMYDPFGGVADLERKLIRAVGDPKLRFAEDALRILRACRFAAQLGFSIDAATKAAMLHRKRYLTFISFERIAHELSLLLCGSAAGNILMTEADVISIVVPEIAAARGFDQRSPYHCYDVLEHTAHVIDQTPAEPLLRWAALCHDLGKPASFFLDDQGIGHFYGHTIVGAHIAAGIMQRLKMPRTFCDQVISLVRHHDDEINTTKRSVKRAIRSLDGNPELLRLLCKLQKADALAHAPEHQGGAAHADRIEAILDDIIAESAALFVTDLAIDGHDILALGIDQGPAIGILLNQALEAVIDERVHNERDALLTFVRKQAHILLKSRH